MVKHKRLLLIPIIIISILTILPTSKNNIIKKELIKNISIKKDNEIGRLIIPKININKKLYNIDSPNNTVNKNITILKESIEPDKDNSIMILAAHSGEGDIAYFNKLNELDINDEITLIYKNKKYHYLVKEYYEEKKNGYININKDYKKQLILTTCSPNKDKYQLIVNCTEKEPN